MDVNVKQMKYIQNFKSNLLEGIEYYKKLIPSLKKETDQYVSNMKEELKNAVEVLSSLQLPKLG
jgi:hypothetical protein